MCDPIIFCEICLKEPKTRVAGNKYVCDKCNSSTGGIPTFIETTYIRSYGHVSKKRIGEILRRKILPTKPTEQGVDYYVGRKMENGTISEKEPNY